jgi:hypothetical protein
LQGTGSGGGSYAGVGVWGTQHGMGGSGVVIIRYPIL